MKIEIWTVSTLVPGDTAPIAPVAFASEKEAEAFLEAKVKDDWETADLEGEEGKPIPYPGDSFQATIVMREHYDDGSYGEWEMHYHEVDLPDPPRASIVVCISGGVAQVDDAVNWPANLDVYLVDYDTGYGDDDTEKLPIVGDDHALVQRHDASSPSANYSGQLVNDCIAADAK